MPHGGTYRKIRMNECSWPAVSFPNRLHFSWKGNLEEGSASVIVYHLCKHACKNNKYVINAHKDLEHGAVDTTDIRAICYRILLHLCAAHACCLGFVIVEPGMSGMKTTVTFFTRGIYLIKPAVSMRHLYVKCNPPTELHRTMITACLCVWHNCHSSQRRWWGGSGVRQQHEQEAAGRWS